MSRISNSQKSASTELVTPSRSRASLSVWRIHLRRLGAYAQPLGDRLDRLPLTGVVLGVLGSPDGPPWPRVFSSYFIGMAATFPRRRCAPNPGRFSDPHRLRRVGRPGSVIRHMLTLSSLVVAAMED